MPRPGLLAVTLLIAVVGAAAQEPSQQSLGKIARQAEATRSTDRKATRTYTNADLNASPRPPAQSVAPKEGYVSASTGKVVSATEMIAASQEKVDETNGHNLPEAHWRQRADTVRTQVDKLGPRLARLQRREPNANPSLQKMAEQQIATLQQTLMALRKQWATLEESARLARIDMAWIEPAPQFPSQQLSQ